MISAQVSLPTTLKTLNSKDCLLNLQILYQTSHLRKLINTDQLNQQFGSLSAFSITTEEQGNTMDDPNAASSSEPNIPTAETNKSSGLGVFLSVFPLIMRMCNFQWGMYFIDFLKTFYIIYSYTIGISYIVGAFRLEPLLIYPCFLYYLKKSLPFSVEDCAVFLLFSQMYCDLNCKH